MQDLSCRGLYSRLLKTTTIPRRPKKNARASRSTTAATREAQIASFPLPQLAAAGQSASMRSAPMPEGAQQRLRGRTSRGGAASANRAARSASTMLGTSAKCVEWKGTDTSSGCATQSGCGIRAE